MYSGRDGGAALPFFDEFDLSTVDILLISQYVSFLSFQSCARNEGEALFSQRRGSPDRKDRTAVDSCRNSCDELPASLRYALGTKYQRVLDLCILTRTSPESMQMLSSGPSCCEASDRLTSHPTMCVSYHSGSNLQAYVHSIWHLSLYPDLHQCGTCSVSSFSMMIGTCR